MSERQRNHGVHFLLCLCVKDTLVSLVGYEYQFSMVEDLVELKYRDHLTKSSRVFSWVIGIMWQDLPGTSGWSDGDSHDVWSLVTITKRWGPCGPGMVFCVQNCLSPKGCDCWAVQVLWLH